MITIKSSDEIVLMRKANQIVRDCLNMLEEKVAVGVTTAQLDKLAYDFINKCNAKPSFLGYNGFPASICASVNEQVVHGIPSKKVVLESGDIISIDCGSIYMGFQGDAARTFCVGDVTKEKKQLVEVTQQSFFEGVNTLKEGARLGDLGSAIETYAKSFGYGVVRALVGHGIGRNMHEDPEVPNYGVAGRGLRLKAGMTIAIEPMINMGTHEVAILDDGWTVVTKDGLPSAHYENTVLITSDGVEILSL